MGWHGWRILGGLTRAAWGGACPALRHLPGVRMVAPWYSWRFSGCCCCAMMVNVKLSKLSLMNKQTKEETGEYTQLAHTASS